MGMAADNEIDVAGTLHESWVNIRLASETYVRQGDDHIALLLGLEVLGPFVDYLGVLKGWNLVGDFLGDKGGDVRHKTDDSDLHPSFLHDGVRLHVLGKSDVREVIVCTDNRALDVGQAAGKLIDSVVELVVAEGDTIVLHRVDEVDLDVTSEHGEIGRALTEVTGVEKEYITFSVGFHDTVTVSRALNHSAKTFPPTGTLRLKMAVGVVHVKDGEPSLGRSVNIHKRREQAYS